MLPGRNYTGHNDEAKGVGNVSLFRNARKKKWINWRAYGGEQ